MIAREATLDDNTGIDAATTGAAHGCCEMMMRFLLLGTQLFIRKH